MHRSTESRQVEARRELWAICHFPTALDRCGKTGLPFQKERHRHCGPVPLVAHKPVRGTCPLDGAFPSFPFLFFPLPSVDEQAQRNTLEPCRAGSCHWPLSEPEHLLKRLFGGKTPLLEQRPCNGRQKSTEFVGLDFFPSPREPSHQAPDAPECAIPDWSGRFQMDGRSGPMRTISRPEHFHTETVAVRVMCIYGEVALF